MEGCIIHFKGKDGPLTAFTPISLKKFVECHSLWLHLDGEAREVAEKSCKIVQSIKSGNLSNEYLQYHRGCYSNFTNVAMIRRAQARIGKKKESAMKAESDCSEANSEESLGPARKTLRSSNTVKPVSAARSRDILPPICIICGQQNSYITDSVSRFFSK